MYNPTAGKDIQDLDGNSPSSFFFEVCFVCHGQELSDIIVSEYISIYIFANVRGSNGMNFVHAIYVKLYLCIYDLIERDSLCL